MYQAILIGLRIAAGASVRGASGAAVRGATGAAARGGGGALVRSTTVRGAGGGLMRGLGGAARGGGGGLLRGLGGAAVRGIGGTLVKSALGGLGKGKKDENKQVSTRKLIPQSSKGGGGGALVKTKTTSIIRPQGSAPDTSSDKKSNGGDLITELTAIKETLIKIKSVLGSNLANTLRNQRSQRILRSKEKSAKREAELEKKDPKKGPGKILEGSKKKLSFFDMIWRYLSNVLMGSLLNFLFNYAPIIIKMFDDIGKGLENPLQQLKLGIITLTTLFPKQIKFLAKLTSKIIGPPAKLIGKLLSKAAGVAGLLFKKAGGVIFNLIKGPLNTLIKKIGGEALQRGIKGGAQAAGSLVKRGASRAVTRAGLAVAGRGGVKTAASIIKRIKAYSGVFKRVPIIGMLIGVGIDLALGEPLDRALVGAAGASLGAAVGSAIGQGLIPIPVVGAIVGGAVGSAIGDWAGKKIYQNLTGRMGPVDKANPMPVERRASGGGIGGVFSSIGSFFGGKQSTPAKKSVSKTTKISPQVAKKAQESVVKDERSLQRFQNLSSIFAGTPFVGQLLKMGIDIGLGATVEKPQTDAAAQDIGYSIGKALENDEFSVPGLNRRIIGPLTKNLTEWAKKKIFYEVKAREGSFPELEKGDETTASGGKKGGGGDGGDGGTPGPIVTGGNADFWTLVAIASLESGNPQGRADVAQSIYNRLASGVYTGKTIKDLILAQNQYQPTRESDTSLWRSISDKQSAIAAVNSHKNGRGRASKMIEETAAAIQNSALQQSAAQFVGGRTDFWAESLSPPANGIGYVVRNGHRFGWFVGPAAISYGRKNPGPARAPKLGDIAVTIAPSGGGGGVEPSSNANLAGLPKQSKQIVFHWTAGNYTSTGGPYHTVFTGDGKKHQKTSYNQRTPGTLYRSDAINLSLAANPDTGQWPTEKQLEAMAKETATLAKNWGWNKSSINVRNVTGHGEVGAGKDVGNLSKNISTGRDPSKGPAGAKDNYGPVTWGGDGSRWDLSRLKPSDKYGQGENAFRERVKRNMGGGYGFNHHTLPSLAMGGGHVVTSSMGMRNFALSPGMHMGVDIAGKTGEPLQAFTDGTVEATSPPSPSAGYGNWVSWVDANGIGHLYGHMNKAPFVKPGQKIKKGTILGELGSTGNSSGPHLHWEAATNPQDTGRPKSNVLSRFNPLSKYNKESPFGGSIMPDGSVTDTSQIAKTSDQPGVRSPGPGSSDTSQNQITEADYNFVVRGDPAVAGMGGGSGGSGGKGGGNGTEAITWKEWGKYLRGIGFTPNENAWDPGKYNNSKHATPDHGHNAMDAGWWTDDNYVSNTKKWERIFAPLEGDAFRQVIGPIEDPGGHGNGTNTHLHFTAKNLDSKGKIPLTPKLKALMGNPNPTATLGAGGDSPSPGAGPGTGPEQASTSENQITEADYNYVVRGDAAIPGYDESFNKLYQDNSIKQDPLSKNQPVVNLKVENIQQKPSYDQGGKQNILMMPIPTQPQMTNGSNVTSGKRLPMDSIGLNNINVRAESARQILSVVLFKL